MNCEDAEVSFWKPVEDPGTRLEVRGKAINCGATAHQLPFDDAKKAKRMALG